MDSELERYILDHISPEDPVLAELDRQTHLRMIQPRMLSLAGAVAGDVCTDGRSDVYT